MVRQLIFDEEAREYYRKGVDTIANTVRVTLGPRGRNVLLEKKFGSPASTHDGATVAREIEIEDPFAKIGVSVIKDAIKKVGDEVGDGTTTSTILAQAMIREGYKNIAAGAEPVELKKGIEKAVAAVIEELKRMAKPVSTREEITRVATITSLDPEIGSVIGDIMNRVGSNGVVTVEEGKGITLETEYVEGMRFDRGYISPYFITDAEKMEAVVEEPYILIVDKKLESVQDVLPALEKIAPISKNIVIIAEEVEKDALAALVVNKLKGNLNVLAVKAPGFGDRRKAMLEDIAILTGGQVISEEKGRKLDSVNVEDFGRARRVIADKDNTTIVEGKGSPAMIQGRIKQLKAEMDETNSDYEKEKLQERLARLAGGVGIIKVGAPTEAEMKEKKLRIQGALSATKAATEEGIVPGGGVALLNAASVIDKLNLTGDEKIGAEIVRKALEEPVKQLAVNAGFDGSVVLNRIKEMKPGFGFDVVREEYVNMEERGIVDPLKVIRIALQNAASVAAISMITEALVAYVPEKEAPPPGPPAAY
ncbi:MAG: chaperonin GroEL [Dehalococcoidales bacterium]|jgi:chaperonin GroEL|nr:chaperonin GroEL [Dehalococcoidales bacterium]